MVSGPQIEAEKDPVRAGHIANESAQGQRQTFNERGGGDDLLTPGEDRLLVNIYYLKIIAVMKVVLANFFDVLNGPGGSWRHAGDVKAEEIFFLANPGVGSRSVAMLRALKSFAGHNGRGCNLSMAQFEC
jgi:hypothetical protein